MNQDLSDLRTKIVDSVQELALKNEGDPLARTQVMLEMMRADTASSEVYIKAYEVAQQIEDANERMDVMLDIIFEIDRKVAASQLDSEKVEEPTSDDNAEDNESGETNHEQ